MSQESNFTREDEQRIRQRMNKRYQEWQGFAIHGVVFLLVNLCLWALWAAMNGVPFVHEAFVSLTNNPTLVKNLESILLPLIFTLGWGVGLVAHYVHYYYEHGAGADRHEEAIQREIERYKASRAFEKPKNDEAVRLELNDDGEIEEVYDNQPARAAKRARR